MKSSRVTILATACLLQSVCFGQSIFINFDTDAYGNPITAPVLFDQTSPLTELYAPLGVHFSGPSGNTGGAIVNQVGFFGVPALSGVNFFGFNLTTYAVAPETITFDTPMTSVSIFAAGGELTATFTMQAFSAGGLLLDNDSVTTLGYDELSVFSLDGIQRVVLSESGNGLGFVYDNLTATPVPEPTSLSQFLFGFTVLLLFCRLTNKATIDGAGAPRPAIACKSSLSNPER